MAPSFPSIEIRRLVFCREEDFFRQKTKKKLRHDENKTIFSFSSLEKQLVALVCRLCVLRDETKRNETVWLTDTDKCIIASVCRDFFSRFSETIRRNAVTIQHR